MEKYIVVLGGNTPDREGCNYLSSVDKDGLHFSHDIDDAITFTDKDRCVFLARALMVFHTVDVYFAKVESIRSFEYVW